MRLHAIDAINVGSCMLQGYMYLLWPYFHVHSTAKVSDLNGSFYALRMHFSITSFYLKSYYIVISLNPILYLICISWWCMDVIVCLVKVKSEI